MAAIEKQRTYPQIPSKVWWDLRERFQRAMPGQVTPSYLQSVLGVQEGHAKNLIPHLRAVNLIDADGKLTPLANEWRTSEGYPAVCQQIIEAVYPAGLRDAVPPSDADVDAARRWFMREMGVGESAARRMAAFYTLLSAGDPNAATERPKRGSASIAAARPQTRPSSRTTRTPSPPPAAPTPPPQPISQPETRPGLHIDVQVHIPSDASLQQIDAIFASMAKHLYPPRL